MLPIMLSFRLERTPQKNHLSGIKERVDKISKVLLGDAMEQQLG